MDITEEVGATRGDRGGLAMGQAHASLVPTRAVTGIPKALLGIALAAGLASAEPTESRPVESLEVTILSTMLTDSRGLGEWGFAAMVEADGYRVLYDTGYRPETVLRNAEELGVELATAQDVVLSHNHGDHTGGLLTLRRALRPRQPSALSRVHVGAGLFAPRRYPPQIAEMGFEFPAMQEVREHYEALGGTVHVHETPVALAPGVWLTGPVPRVHPERNWSPGVKVMRGESWEPDEVLEDSALVIETAKGLVVVTGCGHAGVINILDYARTMVPERPVHAVIGGLHLFAAGDDTLGWTADQMARHEVAHLVGAHCTGLHATTFLRDRLGLPRARAVVGAVGATFSLDDGIDPLRLAR